MSAYVPTRAGAMHRAIGIRTLVVAIGMLGLIVTSLLAAPMVFGGGELRVSAMSDSNPLISVGGLRSEKRLGFVTVTGQAVNVSDQGIKSAEAVVEFLDRN